MKALVILIAVIATSALAQDKPMTDEERTKESVAVFSGTVISNGFDKVVKGNEWWKATIRVSSVEESDGSVSTNTVMVLNIGKDTKLTPKQQVKCWCIHWYYDGEQVLYIPWPSWVKSMNEMSSTRG